MNFATPLPVQATHQESHRSPSRQSPSPRRFTPSLPNFDNATNEDKSDEAKPSDVVQAGQQDCTSDDDSDDDSDLMLRQPEMGNFFRERWTLTRGRLLRSASEACLLIPGSCECDTTAWNAMDDADNKVKVDWSFGVNEGPVPRWQLVWLWEMKRAGLWGEGGRSLSTGLRGTLSNTQAAQTKASVV